MTFLEKLKEIETHLHKIGQINQGIHSTGKYTGIEKDLVKEYLRKLYELYDELALLKGSPDSEPVVIETETIQAPVLTEEPVAEVIPEITVKEPVVKKEEVVPPAEPELVKEDVQDVADESVSLFEKFQTESEKKEVNTKSLSNKPLKEIIPLNDKFMFIKEFFDNSISKYDDMLDKVENAGKKETAVDYMKENVWSSEIFDKNEELIDRFIKILDSKFSDQV